VAIVIAAFANERLLRRRLPSRLLRLATSIIRAANPPFISHPSTGIESIVRRAERKLRFEASETPKLWT
jgi:hypothetical protein